MTALLIMYCGAPGDEGHQVFDVPEILATFWRMQSALYSLRSLLLPKPLMTAKSLLGTLLAVAGFIIPFLIRIDGLSYAGHIALSLFLMAAALWMFEPIPIYATSLLVILLGILLLSSQGFMYAGAELPTVAPADMGEGRWRVPLSALDGDRLVVVLAGQPGSVPVQVTVVDIQGEEAVVRSERLQGASVAVNARHPLAGYKPSSAADYLNTLANSVIILFLGGLLMAEAAFKY